MKNIVMNTDCLQGMQAVKTDSVKLIIADPPYFLGMTHDGKKGSFVDLAICRPFYEALFQEFRRVLRDDGEIYWFTDWRGYAFYYPHFDAALGANNLIVWDKISGPGCHYAFCHELIVYASMKKNIIKRGQNVWRMKSFASGAKKTNGKKVHPTQKPLELIERIIEDASKPGDLVCDPFAGSGTTAIAARRHDRDFVGFELDLKNYQTLVERMDREQILHRQIELK